MREIVCVPVYDVFFGGDMIGAGLARIKSTVCVRYLGRETTKYTVIYSIRCICTVLAIPRYE